MIIMPFPPGHYYSNGEFICYNDLSDVKMIHMDSIEEIAFCLRSKLEKAVKKSYSLCPYWFFIKWWLRFIISLCYR